MCMGLSSISVLSQFEWFDQLFDLFIRNNNSSLPFGSEFNFIDDQNERKSTT